MRTFPQQGQSSWTASVAVLGLRFPPEPARHRAVFSRRRLALRQTVRIEVFLCILGPHFMRRWATSISTWLTGARLRPPANAGVRLSHVPAGFTADDVPILSKSLLCALGVAGRLFRVVRSLHHVYNAPDSPWPACRPFYDEPVRFGSELCTKDRREERAGDFPEV